MAARRRLGEALQGFVDPSSSSRAPEQAAMRPERAARAAPRLLGRPARLPSASNTHAELVLAESTLLGLARVSHGC